MSRVISKTRNRGLTVNGADEGRMSSGDRRQQLIRIAISLFSQKGFSGTTTKEIARAAGVTEAIIFRHFPTKNDLYAAILDYKACELRSDEWLEELGRYAAERDDEGLFREVIARIIEHHRTDKDFMRLMLYSALEDHSLTNKFKEKWTKPLYKFLRDYIVMRQREGAFENRHPNAVVRSLFALPVYHSLAKYIFDFKTMDVSEADALDNFTRLLLDGLRTSSARKSSPKPAAKKME
jgi:TetR/AcrR family transcriptional regulator